MNRAVRVMMLCATLMSLTKAAAAQTRRAQPLSTNPMPVYPAMLREAGVSGSVLAQFVVDSTDRSFPAAFS